MARTFNFKGTMSYIPLSGGFWGILTEDGRKYRPVNELAADFRLEGLAVRVEASRHIGISIFMWGTEINIHHIEPA